MSSTRQQKVARLVQKELGHILQFDMRHVTGHAMVTVTRVSVTSDLAQARVYLSLFATENKETLFTLIAGQNKDIRRKLAERVKHQLRFMPELEFVHDDSLDYIENIEKLLKQ